MLPPVNTRRPWARGGGLAARAGDADHGLAFEQPPGKFGFGHDFGLRAVFAHGQERLDHGLCRSGARNDEIRALEVGGSVFTAEDGHMVFIKPGGKIRGHLIRLLFEQAHVRAEFAQQTDGGATASACAYDGDAAMRKIKRTHDGIPQRSLRTERDMMARSTEMIQNRTMILDSGSG